MSGLLLENYEQLIKLHGLRTDKDVEFGGAVNFVAGISRSLSPTGANDHVSIQTYINAVGLAGGGEIILRAGNYDISDKITILYDNIHLVGEGDTTNLVAANALNKTLIQIGDGGTTAVDNVVIENFQITGNDDNQSSATYGIHLYKLCSNIVVRDMYIHDLYGKGVYNDGDLTTRSTYVQILNNRIFDTNSAGDYDGIDNQNCNYLLIEGNIVIRPGDDAIDLGTCDYAVVNGNTVRGSTSSQTGVGTGIETDACNHLIISNNAIHQANDYSIRIENQNNTVCIGNNIYQSWHKGIELQGADYCIVTGNSIRRTGQTTNNTYSAIDLNSDGSNHCTNNRITNNIIREDGSNKAQYGIKETDANQNYNTITDNDISGAVTAAFLRSGANSVFRNNRSSTDVSVESAFTSSVATTDATVTTVATIPVPASTTVVIEAKVIGRRTGGASGTTEDTAVYMFAACYKNVSGTATEVGEGSIFSAEDQAGWDCTASASGSNILIRVTGAAANNITWAASYKVTQLVV